MTQPGETDGYSVEAHVEALLKHGAPVDAVLFAADAIPARIVKRYAAQGSTPVVLLHNKHEYEVIQEELLNFDKGLIRHDPAKIEQAVRGLLRTRRKPAHVVHR